MKLYIAALLALCLASAVAEDKYEKLLKKWGKAKAMEACFGGSNFKNWMMMMKKAKAKCSGMPAPEVELPMFQGKVRIANALQRQGNELSPSQENYVDDMMRKAFIRQMMRKHMAQLFDDDDDHNERFRRQAEEEEEHVLDLGDNMVEKLKEMEAKCVAEIGNFTCIVQETGVINENLEVDLTTLNAMMDKMDWGVDEQGVDRTWLRERLDKVHGMCKDYSDSLPESVLTFDESMPEYLIRLIHFKKCTKFYKLEACMYSDVRHHLAMSGKPVETLAEESGLAPDDLVPLVAMLFLM